ncbi:MAG TPA: hypothetical protein VM425_20190 [Myxococcota bacterium]|nr:hypothetical protein [Myxococcota bacterium]
MKTSILIIAMLILSTGATAVANDGVIVPSRPQLATLYRDGYAVLEEQISADGPGAAIRLPAETDPTSVQVLRDGNQAGSVQLEELFEKESTTEKTFVNGVAVERMVNTIKRVGYLLRPAPAGSGAKNRLTLRYGTTGIGWQPQLVTEILDEERVSVTLTALITNRALNLEKCRIYLASSAGQLPSKLYFSAAMHHGYQPSINSGTRSADLVYDAGSQTIIKDRTTLLTVLSARSRYDKRLVWRTDTRERIQAVLIIPNPFSRPLCPAPARLLRQSVLISLDHAEWAPPGADIVMAAGHASDIEVERSVDTTENRANRTRPFRHDVKFKVVNRGPERVRLETVMPKMFGSKHKTLYRFKQEPDRRPGELFIWDLDLKKGQTEVISFSFDSEYPRFSAYQTFEKARYEMF